MSASGPVEQRVREALARIAAVNDQWHIFVALDADRAIADAKASDQRHDDGRSHGVLDGVLVAIKDNIDVEGLPSAAGIGAFRDRIAEADAHVVARLRAAGAIILGKLNMHEGALGATTDNPVFGRCANPLAPDHTPGGSSGGSAAAVAAGIAPLTLGTDTMGSVRIPAAYCGVWGLKPTAGLVAQTGLLHLSWTLDTIGLLADTPALLAAGLSVIAGPVNDDPSSHAPPDDWSVGFRHGTGLAGVVLGRPTALDEVPLEPAVADAYAAALAAAENGGATVRPIDISGWQPGKLRRAGLLAVEAEGAFLLADALARDPDGFSAEFRGFLDYGVRASAARLAGSYHLLRNVGHAARQAVNGVDALVLPTAPQTAFRHGAPVPVNQADLTALANAAGCPALSIPWPEEPGALPAGIQLVGSPHSDGHLLSIGAALRSAA